MFFNSTALCIRILGYFYMNADISNYDLFQYCLNIVKADLQLAVRSKRPERSIALFQFCSRRSNFEPLGVEGISTPRRTNFGRTNQIIELCKHKHLMYCFQVIKYSFAQGKAQKRGYDQNMSIERAPSTGGRT